MGWIDFFYESFVTSFWDSTLLDGDRMDVLECFAKTEELRKVKTVLCVVASEILGALWVLETGFIETEKSKFGFLVRR